MTHQEAILRALSYKNYHSTPLIEAARDIYKRFTNEGMSAGSTNRLREMRAAGLITSEKDLFSEELIWSITEAGRQKLKSKEVLIAV